MQIGETNALLTARLKAAVEIREETTIIPKPVVKVRPGLHVPIDLRNPTETVRTLWKEKINRTANRLF